MTTYAYPYKRGVGWRSQEFRSHPESPFNPPGGHTGFDQAMPSGTPLYAPADGIVRNSSWLTANYLDNPWWLTQFGGDTLVLDCTDSFGRSETEPTFIFAHLSDSIAPVGAKVKKGQLIAISGNSGTATTGPHVHIEALPPNWDWNNGVYGRVNPEDYFTEYPGEITPQSSTTPAPQEDELTQEQYDKLMAVLVETQLRASKALAVATENQFRINKVYEVNKQIAAKTGTPVDYAKIDEIVDSSIAAGVDVRISVNGKEAV